MKRVKEKSVGVVDTRERLHVLLLLLIIIIIIIVPSPFCLTARLALFSPSLPTVHSPGEVPFTKQKIASRRHQNHLSGSPGVIPAN